jgi:hypothetical protein
MTRARKASVVAALTTTLAFGAAPTLSGASYAATKGPVAAYVLAWRQSAPKTLLVAYRARSTAVAAEVAACTVHAKPTFNLPKPHYYSFAPQHFTLSGPKARYTYIGAFTLPPNPSVITIKHVWVSCS